MECEYALDNDSQLVRQSVRHLSFPFGFCSFGNWNAKCDYCNKSESILLGVYEQHSVLNWTHGIHDEQVNFKLKSRPLCNGSFVRHCRRGGFFDWIWMIDRYFEMIPCQGSIYVMIRIVWEGYTFTDIISIRYSQLFNICQDRGRTCEYLSETNDYWLRDEVKIFLWNARENRIE